VAFDVPGFFNVAVALHKEWNHNGIVPQLVAIGVGCPGACAENVSFRPWLCENALLDLILAI
jgi:hypothetical protein